jgi:hypothetical protein
MNLDIKQNLSVYYYIKDTLSGYPSIQITDDYPNTELVLPSVAVVGNEIFSRPLELGNRHGLRNRVWNIEVYGDNKNQRDEITYVIMDNVELNIPVYDYDQGFPPTSVPQLGVLKLKPNTLIATPTRVFPDLTERLYWRTSIKFMTEYESIT